MANAHTRTITIKLGEAERAELTSMARSRSLPAALALVRASCLRPKVTTGPAPMLPRGWGSIKAR